MGCIEEPDDIDLVLVLPPEWDDAADLKPYQYNLVAPRLVKRSYRFDLIAVSFGSTDEIEWIEFFGQVNPKWSDKFGWPDDLQKGILRVIL